jgi:penicillin-binding protein 1B
MKRALGIREYRDAKPFQAPDGIVTVDIDPQSGMPATPSCPSRRAEVYIVGTQPVGSCPLHGGRQVTNVAGWDTTPPAGPAAPAASTPHPAVPGAAAPAAAADARRASAISGAQVAQSPPDAATPPKQEKEKKGIFRRLIGVFK